MKDLTKELQDKWRHVYLDNFFTSFSYSVTWKRVGSMGVAQPERVGMVFQRSSRQQNLRTGKIHTLHKQKLRQTICGLCHDGISHHKLEGILHAWHITSQVGAYTMHVYQHSSMVYQCMPAITTEDIPWKSHIPFTMRYITCIAQRISRDRFRDIPIQAYLQLCR